MSETSPPKNSTKASGKKTAPADKRVASAKRGGRRVSRPFPHLPFEDALSLAQSIQEVAGPNPIRRLTLFDQIGRAPESGPSRQWITTAARYKLIKGNAASEQLQLTNEGDLATSRDAADRERARAKIKLAIETIDLFSSLYSKFAGQKLPSSALLEDAAGDLGVPEKMRAEAVEMFIVNLRYVGLLQTLSGAERILTTDHAVDQLPVGEGRYVPASAQVTDGPLTLHADAEFDRMCFFVSPIGEEGSEFRDHSDLILESLIRPAIEPLGLEVKRADHIQNPGLINKQVFEHLLQARLVIADLSYYNPNVFYELAIRHARSLPAVQMIRKADRIPFDINQSRTVIFDTTDLYSFVPKIETYRAEISSHARRAIEDPDSAENPFRIFFPDTQR